MNQMRLRWRQGVFLLFPLVSACDYSISVSRKGAIAKAWDLNCIESALRPLGKVDTQVRVQRDPDQGGDLKTVKLTSISIQSSPQVTLEIWPLKPSGWGFKQRWGSLGKQLSNSERSEVLAQFNRQFTTLRRACDMDFYVIETKSSPN